MRRTDFQDLWTDLPWDGWALPLDVAKAMSAELLNQGRKLNILEMGSGLSTVVLSRFVDLVPGSQLWTLEHDREHLARTVELVNRHTVFTPAVHLKLAELGPVEAGVCYSPGALPRGVAFDFVLVDGPPGGVGRAETLPMVWPRLASNFQIWLDDFQRPGERDAVGRWLTKFPVQATAEDLGRGLAIIRPRQP